MPSIHREEVVSAGFDDFLASLPESASTGLRIPRAKLPQRYRFLLDVVVLERGDAIVGLRQLLTLAAVVFSGEGDLAPGYPYEREVVSPVWRFPDTGPPKWTLTAEPESAPRDTPTGPNDQDTFVFRDSDTPALVYSTAHFPAVPLAPGYLGLDGYTPPAMQGTPILWARDMRLPWQATEFQSMRIMATRPTRFRFYLDLLQSDPATRVNLPPPANTVALASWPALAPEDLFTLLFPGSAIYWRAAGSILVEKVTP
jgi:hypothetical protein